MPENTGTRGTEPKQEELLFGNFKILTDDKGNPQLLGKGTFGRTYKAQHQFVETVVALKVVGERFATDPVVRQRFLVEGRAAAKLAHPNIARLYDFGEKDGLLYYALDYCGGGDLAAYVSKHGPLASERLVALAREMAGALQCAHGAGLIHRDIKPSNIMLVGSGPNEFSTKLIDFGLVHAMDHPAGTDPASATDDPASSSGKSRFAGTPLFASPEQLREEALDARSDLFSLGMTLWHLAIGASPEGGSLTQIATSRLNADSYEGRLPVNLPPELRCCLARLLEKDRAKRMGTAAELLATLPAIDSGATFPAPLVADIVQPTEADGKGQESLADLEVIAHPLENDWSLLSRKHEAITGVYYLAESADTGTDKTWLHVVNPWLLDDGVLMERLRRHVAVLKGLQLDGVLPVRALRAYSDYAALVLERPEAGDLLTVLRGQPRTSLAEILPVLDKIAQTADALAAAGIPPPELQPGRIFLRSEEETNVPVALAQVHPLLFPKFLTATEAPSLVNAQDEDAASGTLTDDMLTDPSRMDDAQGQFANLIYRVVAGRDCPQAAALATQGYVSVPGLSESANRFLSLVIAHQATHESCGDLLRKLLRAEGLSAGHGTGGSASGAPIASRAGRSTPRGTAPHPPALSSARGFPAGSVATGARRDLLASRAATSAGARPPTIAPQAKLPPPVTATVQPKVVKPEGGSKTPVLAIVLVAMILSLGGAAAYKSGWLHLTGGAATDGKANSGGTLADGTTVQILHTDGLPSQVAYLHEGKRLTATESGINTTVNVGGLPRKFPLDLTVEAKGFKPATVTFSDENSLQTPQPPPLLFRNTGKMVFVGDVEKYTQVSATMVDLLPSEKGLDTVAIENGDRAVEIRQGGKNSLELSTGIYTISARDDRRLTPKLFLEKKFEVKAGDTVSVRLEAPGS